MSTLFHGAFNLIKIRSPHLLPIFYRLFCSCMNVLSDIYISQSEIEKSVGYIFFHWRFVFVNFWFYFCLYKGKVTYYTNNASYILGRRHFICNHSVSIGCVPKCICLSFLCDFVEVSLIGQFIRHSC